MEYKERKRLLLFGLPWTFTKYTVREEDVVINDGLLKTHENNCYMYKIQDRNLLYRGYHSPEAYAGTYKKCQGS